MLSNARSWSTILPGTCRDRNPLHFCIWMSVWLALGILMPLPRAFGQGAIAFQPEIGTFPSGVMLNVTPVVSADRRYVRLTNLNFTSTTLEGFDNFVIPGAVSGGGVGFGNGGFGGGGFGFGGGGGGGAGGFMSVGSGALGPTGPMLADPLAAAYIQSVRAANAPAFSIPRESPRPRRRGAARR